MLCFDGGKSYSIFFHIHNGMDPLKLKLTLLTLTSHLQKHCRTQQHTEAVQKGT
jgi:hypothetical protein